MRHVVAIRIPQRSRLLLIARLQRQAQPMLGEIGQVDREMAPKGAMVIPKVMVRVAGLAAQR